MFGFGNKKRDEWCQRVVWEEIERMLNPTKVGTPFELTGDRSGHMKKVSFQHAYIDLYANWLNRMEAEYREGNSPIPDGVLFHSRHMEHIAGGVNFGACFSQEHEGMFLYGVSGETIKQSDMILMEPIDIILTIAEKAPQKSGRSIKLVLKELARKVVHRHSSRSLISSSYCKQIGIELLDAFGFYGWGSDRTDRNGKTIGVAGNTNEVVFDPYRPI